MFIQVLPKLTALSFIRVFAIYMVAWFLRGSSIDSKYVGYLDKFTYIAGYFLATTSFFRRI